MSGSQPLVAISADGTKLSFEHLGGSGPNLLFAHATGFCGAVFHAVAEPLMDRFNCWTMDFRAHGHSGHGDAKLSWSSFADDVLAVVDAASSSNHACEDNRWYGVGHSMGAAALLMAQADRPATFSGLWLFEPIVMPPAVREHRGAGSSQLAQAAQNRRSHFESAEDAVNNYASKAPMNTFDRRVLRDYVDGGFAAEPDGSITLRCTPQNESQVYRMGPEHHTFERLSSITTEVTVACGAPDVGPSAMAPAIASELANATLERHNDLSHFGPMEHPETISRSIVAALGVDTEQAVEHEL